MNNRVQKNKLFNSPHQAMPNPNPNFEKKSETFFSCLHFSIGVVTFLWFMYFLRVYFLKDKSDTASNNWNDDESAYKKQINKFWSILRTSDWHTFGLICFIGTTYAIATLTCLGMFFHTLFGFEFMNYLLYFYETGRYPEQFRASYADQNTLSHTERVQYEKNGLMLAGVPCNNHNFQGNRQKYSKIQIRRPVLSGTSSFKMDADIGMNFDHHSDIDLVDGLWLQRIRRFKNELVQQQMFREKVKDQYDSIYPNKFHPRYLLCRPCYNRYNCHHMHVNYRGYRHHCHAYEMDFGLPRQKMSKVQVYKNNHLLLETIQKTIRVKKDVDWSAPNDYPGRNLHEFVSKKYPPYSDHVDTVFKPRSIVRSLSKQNEWDRINCENASTTSEPKRFCPIEDPCIVHKQRCQSQSSSTNSFPDSDRSFDLKNMVKLSLSKNFPIFKINKRHQFNSIDANGDSEEDEKEMITATSSNCGYTTNTDTDSDHEDVPSGPSVIYLNHNFYYAG